MTRRDRVAAYRHLRGKSGDVAKAAIEMLESRVLLSGDGTLDTATLPPTDLALSNDRVLENQPAGTEVGILTATDPEGGLLTYTLAGGQGDIANWWFSIQDNVLVTNQSIDREWVFHEFLYRWIPFSIRVRATDPEGLSCESSFSIDVENVREPAGGFGVVDGKRHQFVLTGYDTMYAYGRVTFTLTGGCTGTVYDDNTMSLTGTTAKSVLTIATNIRRFDGGYMLGGITADGPLKTILAPKVDLTGDLVLNSSGTSVGDATVAIRFLMMEGAGIQTNGLPIRSLYVPDWIASSDASDQIVAPWIGSIRTGDLAMGVVTSATHRGRAIGSITVTRQIDNANIWAAGGIGSVSAKNGMSGSRIAAAASVGTVSLGRMENSSILVGVERDLEGAFVQDDSGFADPSAKLGSLTVGHREHYRANGNSHISAPIIGKVSLTDIPSDSGRFLHVQQDVPVLTIRESSDGMLAQGTWRAGKPGRPDIIEVLG